MKQVVEQSWCTQDPTKHLVERKIHYLAHCLLLRRKATGCKLGFQKKKKKSNKVTNQQNYPALGLILREQVSFKMLPSHPGSIIVVDSISLARAQKWEKLEILLNLKNKSIVHWKGLL